MATLSGPITSMSMDAVISLAGTLHDKVAAIQTKMNSDKDAVDAVSDQTWYGVPEAIWDDLQSAINLVDLISKKIDSCMV